MKNAYPTRPRPPTRPEHSEAYWRGIKYVILALAGLMLIAIGAALYVIVRSAA